MKQASIAIVVVAVVAVMVVAGAYVVLIGDTGRPDSAIITVTDMYGRIVEVPDHLERVVAVGTASLRFVTYLNGSATVVGVEDFEKKTAASDVGGRTYAIAHPEYATLTSVGPQFGGDAELIASVEPDVIFYSPRTQQSSDCDALQAAVGVPVIGLSTSVDLTGNLQQFYRQVELVGEVLDQQERAVELNAYVESMLDDLRDRTAGIPVNERPTVYIGGLSYGSNHGLDWTTINYAPFIYLNATNVITTGLLSSGTGQISIEEIWKTNPEYVFVDLAGLSLARQQYAQYKDTLDEVPAFRNGNVYGVLQTNWYASNWDTVLLSCYYVGQVLYPERFSDIDLGEKGDEIFSTMLGSPVYDRLVSNLGGDFGPISLAS